MADPQDTFLFDSTFTDTDWKENIRESRTDTMSRDRSACSVTIICPFAKYKAAVRFILGYSWVDQQKFLRREVPVFHPVWPWLFARAVTDITFAKPESKSTSDWEHAVPFATYTWARIAIEFCETRYNVLRDDEVQLYSAGLGFKEWTRHCEQNPQPYVDLAQIDGGQLKAYAPGLGAPLNGRPYIAAPFILARLEKSAFDIVWREVPADLVFNTDDFAPKLAAIQKRVNSATFLGRKPGTVLCESVRTAKSPSPVLTDVFDDLKFTYDVTFEMKYFDPPRGDTSVELYGWNLLPAPRQSGGPQTEAAWVYLPFTHNGANPKFLGGTGNTLYGYYDFYSVFFHYSL